MPLPTGHSNIYECKKACDQYSMRNPLRKYNLESQQKLRQQTGAYYSPETWPDGMQGILRNGQYSEVVATGERYTQRDPRVQSLYYS